MFRYLRTIFCRHEWWQRAWLQSESGYVCIKCGRIQYRKSKV